MNNDLYSVLGVSKNATDDELKKAYRTLSKKYHPDLQSGKTEQQKKEAEEKFKEINSAYAVLSDPDKLSNYDQFGTAEPGGNGFGGNGFNPFDFFRSHFGGNPFGDDFGFSGFSSRSTSNSRKSSVENGEDVQIDVNIDFNEMFYGCQKEFNVNKTEPCSHCSGKGTEPNTEVKECSQCHGRGQVVHTQRNGFMMSQTITTCPSCHGSGYSSTPCSKCHGNKRTQTSAIVSVSIPAGIRNGQNLRVRNAGICGVCGGQNGDLYIHTNVKNSKVFERISPLDVRISMPITALDATLGNSIEVQTPWDTYTLKIPAMTENGHEFKIAGHGIHLQSGEKGDLYVKTQIQPLTNLTPEQKKLCESLANTIERKNVPGYSHIMTSIKEFRELKK